MPPTIPPPLAAYIRSCLSPNNQILISSILGTPSAWLSLRLVFAALHGVVGEDDGDRRGDRGDENENDNGQHQSESGSGVIVMLSLLRPLSLWVEMGKKLGLDISALLRSRRIIYIDGLSSGSAPGLAGETSPLPTTRLKSLSLTDLRDALSTALKSVATTTAIPTTATSISTARGTPTPRVPSTAPSPSKTRTNAISKPIIFLDGIDFLLASQPSITPVALQGFLSTLRSQAHGLTLTCNADSALLQSAASPDTTGTPLERNHAHFVTSMAHRSHWVLQLRGLDTGSAKDVSGVVRVSRGGGGLADEDEGLEKSDGELMDAEWLYQLRTDGSVRVWGRGE